MDCKKVPPPSRKRTGQKPKSYGLGPEDGGNGVRTHGISQTYMGKCKASTLPLSYTPIFFFVDKFAMTVSLGYTCFPVTN